MEDIVKRIAELGKREQGILLDSAMGRPNSKNETAFLRYLKTVPRESKLALIAKLPLQAAQQAEERLAELEPADPKGAGSMEKKLSKLLEKLPELVNRMEAFSRRSMKAMSRNRELIRSHFPELRKIISDQQKGLPRGDLQKAVPEGTETVQLSPADPALASTPNLSDCIGKRQSRRKFTAEPITLAELSYLLWAAQGLRKAAAGGKAVLRNVPSGGNMHPLETYVAVNRVEGLMPGLYRYQPLDHKLAFLFPVKAQAKALSRAALDQDFVGDCAATFIWSAVPYRSEWRFTIEAAKLVLLDAGHACQNLYLACEALGLGTCAIGAYDQKRFDALCKLDGVDEMVVYAAPVGRI